MEVLPQKIKWIKQQVVDGSLFVPFTEVSFGNIQIVLDADFLTIYSDLGMSNSEDQAKLSGIIDL